ncbi:MAG TPA: hypothetical protein VJN68_10075 [Burkholderiaceae bacterium]|nr:hypothetical protein [Burkholderiaceae bacterium]
MLAAGQVIAAVAALIEGAPSMTGRVFTDRAWPFASAELPAWRVYADEEEVTPAGIAFPARQMHELLVHCAGYVRAVSGIDDALHALAAAALTALFATQQTTRLAPLNCSVVLARIERGLETDGESAIGRVVLALRVRFHTFNNAPETIT